MIAALVGLAGSGCAQRLDLPQEPEATGNPGGQVAYVKKYVWEGMGSIADLVLTTGGSLYGVQDSARVQCWFSDTAQPRLNPGRSIPPAVLAADTLSGPVRICEGSHNTLWVAYRFPEPTILRWNIGTSPPTLDSIAVRDTTIHTFGGLAADRDSDFVYVADTQQSTIVKYAPSGSGGRRVTVLATQGNGDFFVQQPTGLFFFADSLLVADTGKNWLQVLDADVPGTGRGQVLGTADEPLALHAPSDVWVDFNGFYYVTDRLGGHTLKITAQGVVDEIVDEFDPESAALPNTLTASTTEVWVIDPERERLSIYQLNAGGGELP